jgi:hypothetical protein
MEDLNEKAERMQLLARRIAKVLNKEDDAMAFAAINFVFLSMVIGSEQGPVVAKAMAATFINNVINSIDSYYSENSDDNHVH